jgi:hypothetical protein
MVDRPIIFSGPMVRALLDGRKTQTRRIIKGVRRDNNIVLREATKTRMGLTTHVIDAPKYPNLLRFAPGDRLWVRESFLVFSDDYGWPDYEDRQCAKPDMTIVYADLESGPLAPAGFEPPSNAKRIVRGVVGHPETFTEIGSIPSIYMPRWASRLTLIVEAVKVEMLTDISEADAQAEGVVPVLGTPGVPIDRHYAAFMQLWESLHGEGATYANPWVVAVQFRVVLANIDAAQT